MSDALRAARRLLRAEAALALLLLAACLAALAAPAPQARRVAVGAPGDATWVADMWQPERSGDGAFRWTSGDSVVSLAGYAASAPLAVTLRMAAPLGERGAGSPLTLLSDGLPAGTFAVSGEWRLYHVLAPPDGRAWHTGALSLQSPTARAGPADGRSLGLALSEAAVRPIGTPLALPLAQRALALLGLGLLARLWAGLLVGPLAARLVGGGAALLPALLAWIAPDRLDALLPSPWAAWLAGALLLALWWLAPSPPRAARPRAAAWAIPGAMAALLALLAAASLGWRIGQDLSIMHYLGLQIAERGAVPYRDFFEQNAPGTYLAHALIAALAGASDLGLRIADLGALAALLALSVAFVRHVSAPAAWGGALLFGLIYLGFGPPMGLQRELLILIPIAAALAIAPVGRLDPSLRAAAVGACFGMAATIKPHAALGAPLVVLAIALAERVSVMLPTAGRRPPPAEDGRSGPRIQGGAGSRVADAIRRSGPPALGSGLWALGSGPSALPRLGLAMLAGLALPALALLAYLAASGALPAFLEVALGYWPLYGELSIIHRIVPPAERPGYLAATFLAELRHQLPFAPALLGAGMACARAGLAGRARVWAGLLWALAAAYTLYPILAGKFWNYHWLPAIYCYALLAGLCLLPQPGGAAEPSHSPPAAGRARRLPARDWAAMLPLALLGATLLWRAQPPAELADVLLGRRAPAPKVERVDRIAAALRARLRPGDTVQPLDWTGGAVQAMLLVRAPMATSFVEDFYFYHHIDDPYIQSLRRRFLAEFDVARPRMVVRITGEDKPWTYGPRTTRSFPELEQRLARGYSVILEGEGYAVLERR